MADISLENCSFKGIADTVQQCPQAYRFWQNTIDLVLEDYRQVGVCKSVRPVGANGSFRWTYQAWSVDACFLFRDPKRVSPQRLVVNAFQTNVWSVTLCFLFVASLLIELVIRFDRLPTPNRHCSLIAVFIELGIFLQQGFTTALRKYLSKIMLLLLVVHSFLQFQYYTTSIVGYLLLESPVSIRRLADFRTNHMDIGFQRSLDYITVADAVNQKQYWPLEAGIRHMLDARFAFQVNCSSAAELLENAFDDEEADSVNLLRVRGQVNIVALPPLDHKRTAISHGLLRAKEFGLLPACLAQWFKGDPAIVNKTKFKPVDLRGFALVLTVHLVGLCASVGLCALECFCTRTGWRIMK